MIQIPEITEWSAKGQSDSLQTEFKLSEWAKDKHDVWRSICLKYGGEPSAWDWGSWFYFDWATSRGWLTVSSVEKARRFGWTRYDDSYEAWIATYKAFENMGILPNQRTRQELESSHTK